jgi:soluble lytic murein transglycosylase-like protein
LEHVTLQNGFSYDCTRQEPVDASHVRLYLFSADASQPTNYIDLAKEAIASVETLPDPPRPAPPAVAVAPPQAKLLEADIPTLLAKASVERNIDVDLLAAVIHAESGGNTKAVSRAGAKGLMQLMPGTARDLGVEDVFRPDQNISGGTTYLDLLLTRYHDVLSLALAAYNAGPAAVDRYHGIPPYRETRNYVTRIENEFKRRKAEIKRHEQAQTTAVASR